MCGVGGGGALQMAPSPPLPSSHPEPARQDDNPTPSPTRPSPRSQSRTWPQESSVLMQKRGAELQFSFSYSLRRMCEQDIWGLKSGGSGFCASLLKKKKEKRFEKKSHSCCGYFSQFLFFLSRGEGCETSSVLWWDARLSALSVLLFIHPRSTQSFFFPLI